MPSVIVWATRGTRQSVVQATLAPLSGRQKQAALRVRIRQTRHTQRGHSAAATGLELICSDSYYLG